MKKICKKHKLPLTRKCYRCKKLICKKEFVKKYHHIFCSRKCAYLWKVEKYYLTEPVKTFIFYFCFGIFSGVLIFGMFKIRDLPVHEKISIRKIFIKDEEKIFDIKRIETCDKIVCLTFDGGFYANRVDSIINILKRKNIEATFFLTGEFIKRYPEKTKKIAENFDVGNHTFSHPHLTTYEINTVHHALPGVNQIKVIEELLLCEEIFEKLTNKKMERIWRAPYGEENYEIKKWAKRIGYTHIRWTYDTQDWKEEIDYEKIIRDIISKKNLNGYIFLMHLGSPYEDKGFYRFLKSLIKELKEREYRFLSIKNALKYYRVMM